MESLEYYENVTKKILFAYDPKLASKIIRNGQDFGYFVSELMIADWKWDNDKKRNNTIKGFRKKRLLWAIGKYFKEIKRRKDFQSYNTKNTDNECEASSILLCNKLLPPNEQAELKEILNIIFNSDILTNREKQYLYEHKIMGSSLREIGNTENLSKERVFEIIKRAKEKILKAVDND